MTAHIVGDHGDRHRDFPRERRARREAVQLAWALHRYLDIQERDLGLRCGSNNAGTALKIGAPAA